MSGQILLLACLFAICLPILSVQLPRTKLFSHARSKLNAETRPEILFKQPPPSIRRHALRQREQQQQQKETSSFGADGTTGADSGTAEQAQAQAQQQSVLNASRKPWDPPFPKRGPGTGLKGEWLVLPPSLPQKSGREMEQEGLAQTLHPPSPDGLGEPEPQGHNTMPGSHSQRHAQKKHTLSGMSILWLMTTALAVLLFLFAFAILIAHCLAWFLVYKTEARLGDARRGLLKGGDMRLCLCAP
ncbi:uncharacterized protein K460DRAFT_399746 [Cucurbitaria berberidis CBS 394.84]|uniref:Uncharacterized protein n=1 Tax=Cucurbitaria berberidis CBS 394.84 TaxID=1168544 RepID=A0A9P4GNC5_9PLEO|nr:uncharacterized protein K460DRAFT_399746 [Cucurbitaria berberidis CBS 394.84]KAF1849633.1 hypothetical protein K460DRAFT_399746 [Cucurbitaria berberidis CBS 394.84]